MIAIKYIILLIILLSTSYIGILLSNKYQNRVKELKDMKSALTIFSTKIKFTYEPIPEIFNQISKQIRSNIGEIFKIASENMKSINATDSWNMALEKSSNSLNKEDIEVLKNLGNLLGRVDLEGQVNEIELVNTFLNTQIEKAEEENKKSSKMYKTLGITVGLAMVIVLI